MSHIKPENKNETEFMEDGSKPNDFVDGVAITTIIIILVLGMAYCLANHWSPILLNTLSKTNIP